MSITINDKAVLKATLSLNRTGVWMCDAVVDSTTPLTDPIVLSDGTNKFTGSIKWGAVYAGKFNLTFVGGKGQLAKVLPSKYYYSLTAKTLLQDLARETGEVLDTLDSSINNTAYLQWVRREAAAAYLVYAIVSDLDINWRITPEGKLWLGTDTFPTSNTNFVLIDIDPINNSRTIAPDSLAIFAGTTLSDGTKVDKVIHTISAQSHRATVYPTT